MTTQDYTAFIGKEVTFLTAIDTAITPSGGFQKTSGVINGVVLFEALNESEFFVEDSTYIFSQVTFIDELPNPSQPV